MIRLTTSAISGSSSTRKIFGKAIIHTLTLQHCDGRRMTLKKVIQVEIFVATAGVFIPFCAESRVHSRRSPTGRQSESSDRRSSGCIEREVIEPAKTPSGDE